MVEAECWAAPWGINNPNFKSSEGIHVLPDCITVQPRWWFLGWDWQGLSSAEHSEFPTPPRSSRSQTGTFVEREVSTESTSKGNEYPSKLKCKNKINKHWQNSSRNTPPLWHLMIHFMSMWNGKSKHVPFLNYAGPFLWHKVTLLAILWKEEFASKAEGGLTKTESPICWSGILATTGN